MCPYPPGTKYHTQVDHFNVFVMKFYFHKVLTVAFFSMLFRRLRLSRKLIKQNQKEMSRKGMEMELLLTECLLSLRKVFISPKIALMDL